MTCPVCGTRKAKRACPALGRDICPVCCGTKRIVEIACPADCGYLVSARAHPAAAVTRQRERDFRFVLPLLEKLPERSYQLLLLFQLVVKRHRKDALPPLADATVAEAAGTFAATLETAARGIIYEHQAPSIPAQRLVAELRAALDAASREAGRPGLERDAAAALRRLEQGARTAKAALGDEGAGGHGHEYLDFLERLPAELASASHETGEREGSGLPPAASPASSRIILP